MDYIFYVGIGIYLVIIVITRFLDESALKILSTEEKGQLIEQMAGLRKYQILVIAILMGGYLTMGYFDKFQWLNRFGNPIYIYFAALAIYVLVMQILTHRKKVQMGLPAAYISKSLISGLMRNLGMIIFLYTLAQTL